MGRILVSTRNALIFLCLTHVLLAAAVQNTLATSTPVNGEQADQTDAQAELRNSIVDAPGLDIQLLTWRAALIFSGTVITVDMNGATAASTSNPDPMVVRITFHVDEGIRGVRTGEEITVQE